MSWWNEKPIRIIEICNPYEFTKMPMEDEADMIVKLGGNTQHFHCWKWKNGMDDKGMYFKSKMNKVGNDDRLGAYLPVAHRKGLKVVVYFNVHWYTKEFGLQHPDWCQIIESGQLIDNVYSTGTSFCVNSPYRDWVFQILKDLCAYEIDGIFFDGPIFFPNTCYCQSCHSLFNEKYGAEPPLKSDLNNRLRKEFIEFQSDSLARFLEDSGRIIKSEGREILFYMNGNGASPCWPTGRDNHKIILNTDILGAEGGFLHGDLNELPIYKPGVSAKIMESQAGDKPTVIFDCVGHKPWSWHPLTTEEIKILLAETVANGANYWLAFFPDDLRNKHLISDVGSFNVFLKNNPDPFFKTESLAEIALMWPWGSLESYRGSSVPLSDFTQQIDSRSIGDIGKEFAGFYQSLHQQQIVFDVIDEGRMEKLSRYKVVIMPNIACLTEKTAVLIAEYVKNGGNIIASFETSLYDEKSVRLADFRLAELFGVKFTDRTLGPMKWDYISVIAEKDSFLSELNINKFIPAPEYGISVEQIKGKRLSCFYRQLKGRYDNVPEISGNPFLIENQFGKGKVYYFAGTFGTAIHEYNFPEYNMLLKNIVNELCPPFVVLENALNVELNCRENNRKIYIYLINHNGGLKRPFTRIIKLSDIKISLHCKVKNNNTVKALRMNEKLEVRENVITLPSLNDFEVIEIDKYDY